MTPFCSSLHVLPPTLEFPAIREGVKKYSDWPTIPQLYVKGEFIGGGDIMVEMYNDGGLEKLMKEHKLIE